MPSIIDGLSPSWLWPSRSPRSDLPSGSGVGVFGDFTPGGFNSQNSRASHSCPPLCQSVSRSGPGMRPPNSWLLWPRMGRERGSVWCWGRGFLEAPQGPPQLLPSLPPPPSQGSGLSALSPRQVSPSLKGFLDRLLVRDPAQRATANELLKHPFVGKAGAPSCIVPLMRQNRMR